MAFTDAGSQPGAITFLCLQNWSRHAPSLESEPGRGGRTYLYNKDKNNNRQNVSIYSNLPETGEGAIETYCLNKQYIYLNITFSPSHPLDRLWHIAQHWPPGRRHSEQWQAADCTSYEPHPVDKVTLVTQQAAIHKLHIQWMISTKWWHESFWCCYQQVNGQTCSRLRARRVFPVYTSRRCCSRDARKPSGGRRHSTSTRRGSEALERPTLIPPTRPPTWSCQPPPEVKQSPWL